MSLALVLVPRVMCLMCLLKAFNPCLWCWAAWPAVFAVEGARRGLNAIINHALVKMCRVWHIWPVRLIP